MLSSKRNQRQKNSPRGTVLILCIALLVILGTLASGFVILTLYERSSSRSLSRADNLEQVRQMSLEYVRTLLLEDIVTADASGNAQFLAGSAKPYDAPGSDPWLASQGIDSSGNWPYISNLIGDSSGDYNDVDPVNELTADNAADTDGDTVRDARWFPDTSTLPFANVTTANGTKYRVAIRIVDTNGLANINVGMADENEPNGILWDSQYPCYLDLRTLLTVGDTGSNLDGTALGRIPSYSDLYTALTNDLYPYLANPDPPQNYIRPFDLAEEIALRMGIISGVDLHPRLRALWQSTFDANSDLLTSYSWTMQIRLPTPTTVVLNVWPIQGSLIDDELEQLGYPAPCKISLQDLLTSENARRAVYLALLATNMGTADAAQFLVNLIDYIDNDADIRVIGPAGTTNSIIDFGDWGLDSTLGAECIPSKYYGVDKQPIISEVYVEWHYIDDGNPPVGGNYTYILDPDPLHHGYAVELYNPTNQDIDLGNWELDINGTAYPLVNPPIVPARGFLTLHGDLAVAISSGNTFPINGLVINSGSSQLIRLRRPGPETPTPAMVAVDRFEDTFDAATLPPPGPSLTAVRTEDSERPGRPVPFGTANPLEPVVSTFRPLVSGTTPKALGDYPTTDIASVSGSGHGGQIVPNNSGQLHSLGELFYVPKVANNGSEAKLIEAMEGQPSGDSDYRLSFSGSLQDTQVAYKILQNLTLRTGLYDNADNDGDGHTDNLGPATAIIPEARVPGLININTAPDKVLEALHYYYIPAGYDLPAFIQSKRPFTSMGDTANKFTSGVPVVNSEDESPPTDGGSPDGITVDNEQKLFHFKNVANLISVRSDVFVVYITIQASDRDGNFATPTATLRTMAIVDRSFCLRANGTPLQNIPLPRILAQTTLP
ncbi:MAG: hypothetical protein GWP14_07620 [Actinobacteria bacterium]|nr:hypothetical protein [Actinomycetota bacterium]